MMITNAETLSGERWTDGNHNFKLNLIRKRTQYLDAINRYLFNALIAREATYEFKNVKNLFLNDL